MNLSALAEPAGPSFGGRFLLVSTPPTALAGIHLLGALHLPLPTDREQEQRANEALGMLWRQGLPGRLPLRYEHPSGERAAPRQPRGTDAGGTRPRVSAAAARSPARTASAVR